MSIATSHSSSIDNHHTKNMAANAPARSALDTKISAYSSSGTSGSIPSESDIAIPSATTGATQIPPPSPYIALALQVQHNLQYQHDWSALRLHTHSAQPPHAALPRPLVSGRPPQRLYVHADQQAREIAALKQRSAQPRGDTTGSETLPGTTADELQPQRIAREWVLPAHLKEKWSLRKFALVFDALEDMDDDGEGRGRGIDAGIGHADGPRAASPSAKRILLALLNDDSTVSYYIMHDGIVKPRQN